MELNLARNKKVIAMIVLFLGMIFGSMAAIQPTFATGVQEIDKTTETDDFAGVDNPLPSPTMKEATDWANRKGEDLQFGVTTLVGWVAVIGFIIGGLVLITGAFTGRIGNGLIMMIISAVVYAGAQYGPALLHFFTDWVAS